jgi:hypothetical protein
MAVPAEEPQDWRRANADAAVDTGLSEMNVRLSNVSFQSG